MELLLIRLLSLGLMYVKKFTSFCPVLKKIHAKENWFLFFCITVYICGLLCKETHYFPLKFLALILPAMSSVMQSRSKRLVSGKKIV